MIGYWVVSDFSVLYYTSEKIHSTSFTAKITSSWLTFCFVFIEKRHKEFDLFLRAVGNMLEYVEQWRRKLWVDGGFYERLLQ